MFENGASFVVVSFDAAAAEQEGDVAGYMGELARLNSVPGSWQLCKSTVNWGQLQVHAPPLLHLGTSHQECRSVAAIPLLHRPAMPPLLA